MKISHKKNESLLQTSVNKIIIFQKLHNKFNAPRSNETNAILINTYIYALISM